MQITRSEWVWWSGQPTATFWGSRRRHGHSWFWTLRLKLSDGPSPWSGRWSRAASDVSALELCVDEAGFGPLRRPPLVRPWVTASGGRDGGRIVGGREAPIRATPDQAVAVASAAPPAGHQLGGRLLVCPGSCASHAHQATAQLGPPLRCRHGCRRPDRLPPSRSAANRRRRPEGARDTRQDARASTLRKGQVRR